MSKKFLKATSMLLAGLLTALTLVGCGNEATDKKQSSTGINKNESNKPVSEPVTIDWLVGGTLTQPDNNSEIVKQVEKRFNADFNLWFVNDENWDDALNVRLSSGEMPDLLQIMNTINIDKYVNMGVLAELPEKKVRESAPHYAQIMDKYDTGKQLWNVTKYNGKTYGFTVCSSDMLYPSVLVWRTDWLKNVGISKIPTTLQEFETAIYKFRNEDPDKNEKKDTYGMSNTSMMAVFGAFGILEAGSSFVGEAPLLNLLKDEKIVFTCIQPEAKDALGLLQKWYKDGVIDPEFVTGENKGGYWALSHAFMNNKVGVTGEINFYHYAPPGTGEGELGGPCYKEMKNLNQAATFDIGKAITGPNGRSGTLSGGGIGGSYGLTTKCMKDEKKVNIIMSMLDSLYSDEEYYKMTQWGIKDVDNKIDSNGNISLINSDPAQIRKKGIMIFNLGENAEWIKKNLPSRYQFADKYASAPGYVKPVVPPTEVYTKNAETLKRIYQQAYIDIITGAKSIDYFDQFVKEFRANGGDETEKAWTEAYNKMIGK